MCAVKWDMIKTIGDLDVVEDLSSESDVEVEVIFFESSNPLKKYLIS